MRLWLWLLCLCAAGCRFYDEGLLQPVFVDAGETPDAAHATISPPEAGVQPPPPADSAPECRPDSACAGEPATSPTCSSAKAPDRPASSKAERSELPPLYFGWTKLTMSAPALTDTAVSAMNGMSGTADARTSFGLDLDGVCTNASSCPQVRDAVSCRSRSAQIPFDGEDCVDNSFASLVSLTSLIPQLGMHFGWSEAMFNCGLARGSFNMLMRVSGYDGELDDASVRVDWYTSNGTVQLPDWTCESSDLPRAVQWDVRSAWQVDEAELVGIAQAGQLPDSRLSDADAYVARGRLVSHFPDGAALRLAGDGKPYRGFYLPLHTGAWLGTLHRGVDQRWTIDDGLVVGRARKDDVVQSFRKQGFCLNAGFDSFYDYISTVIDENADVLLSGENHPEAECDAMSVGIAFQAQEVTPGAISTLEPLVECCAPGSASADCTAVCGDGKVTGQEACDSAIASGEGACPSACPAAVGCKRSVLEGKACQAHCSEQTISELIPSDGCCPSGADSAHDNDCGGGARCGNAILEKGESCDPVGSCGACTSSNPCLRADAIGSRDTCDLECKLTPITECTSGDGCCPTGCTSERDRDCSLRCHNGTVDMNSHETCEDDSPTPCPTSCDDHDPCTRDIRTGSALTCNVQCGHELIAKPIDGDGCCRYDAHANANTDSDCKAVCGNGVSEPGEECDDGNKQSGDGCSATCQKEDVQAICLKQIAMSDACSMCICQNCGTEVRDCYARGTQDEMDACRSTTKCVLQNKCQGLDCYCGSSTFESGCLAPNGPCRSQVVAASEGAIFPPTIVQRASDTNYVIGRVVKLGECGWDNCSKQCGF